MNTPDESYELTVMSWNLHHGEGSDGRLDLGRIASLIGSTGAELVGLQEVDSGFGDRSDWVDQVAELAALTGRRGVYGANLVLPALTAGSRPRRYGCAILSAHPVIRWVNHRLSGAPGAEPRGLLGVRVEPGGLPLDFWTTHLSEADPADRDAQTGQVHQRLLGSPRMILTGDFNAEPGDSELSPLQHWTDAWASAGAGTGATYPDDEPRIRIDHLLTGPGITVNRVEVVAEAAGASDHLPVVASLTLT